MFQIVVPTELRVAVLKTAHIARDIIAFIKICHTYQVNQTSQSHLFLCKTFWWLANILDNMLANLLLVANLPLAGSPFQARFLGFYSVKCWVSDMNYLISTPDRRKSMQLCHVNMLKLHFSCPDNSEAPEVIRPVALVSSAGAYAVGEMRPEVIVNPDDGLCGTDLKIFFQEFGGSLI